MIPLQKTHPKPNFSKTVQVLSVTKALESVIKANQNKPQTEFLKTTTHKGFPKKKDNKKLLKSLETLLLIK